MSDPVPTNYTTGEAVQMRQLHELFLRYGTAQEPATVQAVQVWQIQVLADMNERISALENRL